MKAAVTLLILLVCASVLGACGSQGVQIAKDSPYHRGAVLFRDHCSGCHTLSLVGAQGSATSIANRVKTNGPNFNIRKENAEQVLYAIRNGGFSGAIMPENIVVGKEAQEVADFLAKYSGLQKQNVPATNIPQGEPSSESAGSAAPGTGTGNTTATGAAAAAPGETGAGTGGTGTGTTAKKSKSGK
ncbi:MAG TPA: cytochrome c [Solirubrobacteraceae bacterium]|nr:cytochrome c [Solirubrobacteraceae bacterium]